MQWTEQQILAMAPDESSVKAGRDLARPAKWVSSGSDDRVLWGECQGSGAKPYQTQIDLQETAFKCSCPSRKFPCKHALGLLLLCASSPTAVAPGTPPAWVEEWLAARSAKSEQKTRREEIESQAPDGQPKPSATTNGTSKATLAREAKIANGLGNLQLWLRDLLRSGLAEAGSRSQRQFDDQAARLVDAQAPGLARMVADMAGIPASGSGWQERLLEQIGLIGLAIEGYGRQSTLPDSLRADVRGVIGWTQSQEGVLAREGHRDIWYVVGARSVQEDKLTVQRFWLFGIQARQHALILQFVHPSAPPPTMTLATGMAFEGEVAFFESAAPLRGLIKSRKDIVGSVRLEFGTIAVGLASCAARLATQPWLVQQPLGIAEAYPSRRSNGQWCIVEKTSEHSLTVAPALSDQALWCLSAICGDHPASIFGEFDGSYFFPLGLCQDGKIEAI